LSKYNLVIAGRKETYMSMVDNKELVDWLLKLKINDNWATWFLRNYKKDSKVYDDISNREKFAHFAGMTHLHGVGKVRFEKKHEFKDGIALLEKAERSSVQTKGLIPRPDSESSEHHGKAKVFLDLGNSWAWWDLGSGKSEEEKKGMGHCGNIPSAKPGDHII